MASCTEEQRRILHQTRHEAFTQGEFSQRYDLWRYSSKCLRSLLRMGRRSEYYLPKYLPIYVSYECFQF